GAIPFAADTSLATLLARVERHLEAPPELDALGPVLEQAGRADPASRFPDARSFAAALAEAVSALPAPDPIPLPGPGGPEADPHPTDTAPARPSATGPTTLVNAGATGAERTGRLPPSPSLTAPPPT